MSDEHSRDLVVLGAGSGGYACALRAAQLGLDVALIEQDLVGGTCLHAGCIPTKALLHAADVAEDVRTAARFGVQATLEGIDMQTVQRYKDGVVGRLFRGLSGLVEQRGITVVQGTGRLVDGTTVRVGDQDHRGRAVVVATGSQARSVGAIGIDGQRIVTSDHALRLAEVPRHAIVLGGGVIGCEFASLWRGLGADVTVVESLPRLLAAEDEASSMALARAFTRRGIVVRTGIAVNGAEADDAGVRVTLDDNSVIEGDILLVAVGRSPRTAGLGLEEAGVRLSDGWIDVDAHLRTAVPTVYAVGDVVAGPQLAHRGFAQGVFVAEEVAGLSPTAVPDHLVPRVVYSQPEIASVGLTEIEARDEYGGRVETRTYDLAGNGRSQILKTQGHVKVVRVTDGPVVGIHLVGSGVGEMIGEAQLICGWEAHPDDVAPYLHAHPTLNEALGEAHLALAGKPLHTNV